MLRPLARAIVRHPLPTVLLWLTLVAAVGGVVRVVGSDTSAEASLPGSEAAEGLDLLEQQFPMGASAGERVVFTAPQGVRDPEIEAAMTRFFQQVRTLDHVEAVVSPYEAGASGQVSADGTIAFAALSLKGIDLTAGDDSVDQMQELAPSVAGLRVEFAGLAFTSGEPPQSEMLGIAFAVLVLIFAFGSVLAMGLPIGTALAGVGGGLTLALLVSNLIQVPSVATTVAGMIGLGVGIDYALLIVTRYRELARQGADLDEAIVAAMDTAGRSVLFAGLTVVVSLTGMLAMGTGFIAGLGITAALVVLATMAASITLLPALLKLAGRRIFVTRWRGIGTAALIAIALVLLALGVRGWEAVIGAAGLLLVAGSFIPALRRPLVHRPLRPREAIVWYRLSRWVQTRPWSIAVAATVLLALLAVPSFSLRLGFADASNDPPDSTTYRAYELLSRGFGPGFNGPLLLVAALPDGFDPAATATFTTSAGNLAGLEGVAEVLGPIPNDPAAPTAVMWQVIPETGPQDPATTELVHQLRTNVLSAVEAQLGADVYVTGTVAVLSDFSDFLASKLLVFLLVVLTASFLLLMVVFRSILVPLKAVLLNLLSIGAAYGVVVAVFQWGWGSSLLGIGPGPIEPFVPMMMFAILFGLSMDYEVFLLSRIREEWLHTGDPRTSVADGLAATARVITVAAAIMAVVFGSFLLEDARSVKLLGLGFSVAVLLDASIVRLLLVPATMELLGARNWWLPRWLDRILPRLDVERPMTDS
jgi:RND superfamily putative drug exporter